jgi:hypothetical protein
MEGMGEVTERVFMCVGVFADALKAGYKDIAARVEKETACENLVDEDQLNEEDVNDGDATYYETKSKANKRRERKDKRKKRREVRNKQFEESVGLAMGIAESVVKGLGELVVSVGTAVMEDLAGSGDSNKFTTPSGNNGTFRYRELFEFSTFF